MTKFSVLLPTRNRLEYLKYAVTSVLQQDYANWEIIISDNCSEEDIHGYVASLNDARIKYTRTSSFIPVTANWNNALENSSGDYVIMLGDDDCLMPEYFKRMLSLIQEHNSPDFLYNSAFLYHYPKVLPDHPNGLVHTWGSASFLEGKNAPFLLDKKEALRLVQETMGFKVTFNYNMQFALISRAMIDRLASYGPFFQSPYPDYYAMTALFLKAERILAVPEPLVVIGVTPKSFGFYYFNQQEKQGTEFLKNLPEERIFQKLKKIFMPGTNMNTSWLVALETVKENFDREFPLRVDYNRYRLLQVLHQYKRVISGESVRTEQFQEMSKALSWSEKATYLPSLTSLAYCTRMLPKSYIQRIQQSIISLSHPTYTMKKIEGNFENILAVYSKVNLT